MIRLPRRWYNTAASLFIVFSIFYLLQRISEQPYLYRKPPIGVQFPPKDVNKLPTTQPRKFKDIQFKFGPEPDLDRDLRELRRAKVKNVFERAWSGYVEHAWLEDELKPISGKHETTFGGWGATLVDSLDTLWIMGMEDEFATAIEAASRIDFNTSTAELINVFETTIRYLGGFIGAYDISEGKYPVLLSKAVEVGDLLYRAFDTPNRMPITRWDRYLAFSDPADRIAQEAPDAILVAELGSLSLEFTRLSQLTGDSKYYDAIYTVMRALELSQQKTKVPGLWPTVVNAKALTFTGGHFTIGGMADSVYEYLPKQYLLLGGTVTSYKTMYQRALSAMKSAIFFRPMIPEVDLNEVVPAKSAKSTNIGVLDTLVPGNAIWDERVKKVTLQPQAQHLGCFAGGMVALAAKVFGTEAEDIPIAQRLVEGCTWAYKSMPTGIMPEISHLVPCVAVRSCDWDESEWHRQMLERQRITDDHAQQLSPEGKVEWLIKERRLRPGYTAVDEPKYILRPEAIESVFVLYRLTGDEKLLETGWRMFEAIERNTAARLGNAAIQDVTIEPPAVPNQVDRMESFWMAETLKYFVLLFSDPNLVSLDKFVLNTEAHPLKRPVPGDLILGSKGPAS